MRCLFLLLIASILYSCSQQKYFIVRHAEKSGTIMATDPPLTQRGEQQAQDLMQFLSRENVRYIYSTNTKRTMSTAEPFSRQSGVGIVLYSSDTIPQLANMLKSIRNNNVLVMGHSNTVDDIVNGMTGKKLMSDLPDSEYGFIYLLKRKGTSYRFEKVPFSNR